MKSNHKNASRWKNIIIRAPQYQYAMERYYGLR